MTPQLRRLCASVVIYQLPAKLYASIASTTNTTGKTRLSVLRHLRDRTRGMTRRRLARTSPASSCRPPCLIVVPETKNICSFWDLILPLERGVAPVASQRSKHLLLLLLEWASRRYEFLCLALQCLRGALRTAGCAWFQKRILRRFPFLDFTIRLSPEPSQPPPERSLIHGRYGRHHP